jgi:hypothetical protein
VGDVVVIREDKPFLNKWPLGRVTKVYPGEDGRVRVEIRTESGTYKRLIAKLAPLLDYGL